MTYSHTTTITSIKKTRICMQMQKSSCFSHNNGQTTQTLLHSILSSRTRDPFASRGHFVTIITTPLNAKILPKSNNFNIHTFQFPSQEVGLPEGVENLSAVTDIDSGYKIYQAATLLHGQVEHFVEQHPPDCIVADFCFPWVDEVANKLHIPRFAFNGFSLFTLCAMESLKSHPLPENASGSFVIPNFPHDIIINSKPPIESKSFVDPHLTIALKSHGFIINSFVELDGEEYVEYYEKIIRHKAWHLGKNK